MPTYLKDLIHIPEKIHSGDFVLSLAEGVEKPDQTLADYVVTPQLQLCFRDALQFVKSALDTNSSKITYLHGSFGSGKSHFMAVLDLVLSNHKAARAKKALQDICAENSWTERQKLLMVPYHMIGAESMEQAILGGYARFVKKRHPEADAPSVYLSEGLFKDAAAMRAQIGDDSFFNMLNGGESAPVSSAFGSYGAGWSACSYDAAIKASPGEDDWERVVSALTASIFQSYGYVTSGAAEAYLPLDQGLAVVSRHAKSLGYDGVILFLDELVLWLASRAADPGFVHQEGQKLAKLMEAQEAERPVPIISFVARQRTLQELVGDNVTGMEKAHYDDALRHWSGRFHTIELEDINLPDIVEGRVLKPRDETAVDLIDRAFSETSKRGDVMAVLLTSAGDRASFRKVYPFSPALIETLVAASSLLQRNRTAIRALMELLVQQRDELTLGHVIPVGDLFDIVSKGNDVFSAGMRQHFDNAKRLYQDRFRPMLEAEHHIREEEVNELDGSEDDDTRKKAQRFKNDARLVKTLLLSALVPRVESLQTLTPQRLAALNHGTIKTILDGQEASMVLTKLRRWNTQIGELRVAEGDNPTITLQLVGVDVERILENGAHVDKLGNRRQKIKELLSEATGIQTDDLVSSHTVLWRGTEHTFPVEFANVREKTTDALKHTGDGWKLLIDYPFDVEEFNPKDDLGRIETFRREGGNSKTLVWLPQFLSSKVQRDLGRLVIFDHVLTGANFTEATRHLSPQDVPQARTILENQRSALRSGLLRNLEMAYGLSGKLERDVVNFALLLEQNEQFQSLWSGFSPRPPIAPSLRGAVDELFTQALAHQFPGHPDFPVESRITRGQIKAVWEELARLPEAGGERLEVNKALRARIRSIAEPLQLGKMAETHFVPSQHWGDHFDRKLALEKIEEPTVSDLDRWIDEPNPTGMPNELRDLIILFFAARTNRSFRLHGVAFQPELGGVRREATLVKQPLPSQAHWDSVRELVKKVFDVSFTPLLTGDTVSRFADATQEKATGFQPSVEALPGALAAVMSTLSQDPDTSDRMRAAREARELLKSIVSAKKPKELIEGVASVSLKSSAQELAASIRTARANVQALNDTRIFELLEQASGDNILEELHRALQEHEFVTPLADKLSQVAEKAYSLVRAKLNAEKAVRPAEESAALRHASAVPLATKTAAMREVVSEKSWSALSVSEAKQRLKELSESLVEGRKVDLSWRVWEE